MLKSILKQTGSQCTELKVGVMCAVSLVWNSVALSAGVSGVESSVAEDI